MKNPKVLKSKKNPNQKIRTKFWQKQFLKVLRSSFQNATNKIYRCFKQTKNAKTSKTNQVSRSLSQITFSKSTGYYSLHSILKDTLYWIRNSKFSRSYQMALEYSCTKMAQYTWRKRQRYSVFRAGLRRVSHS